MIFTKEMSRAKRGLNEDPDLIRIPTSRSESIAYLRVNGAPKTKNGSFEVRGLQLDLTKNNSKEAI